MNTRETFSLSRSMEYFTEAELVRQCGHTSADWPILLLKELVDNALDGCDAASVQPKVTVSVDECRLSVRDNGPGLPADLVRRILNFNSRTSDKAAYVSPSRGTMGNGLKLVLSIPFVLNEDRPTTMTIEACGIRHTIVVDTDQIRREPRIGHQEEEIVKTEGTAICIPCDSPCSQDAYTSLDFLQMIADYTLFNPHADFTIRHYGDESTRAACAPIQKWPASETSAHWYGIEELANLIRSHIAADQTAGRKRTVREIVKTFRGLSAPAKQKRVAAAAGMKRDYLVDLLDEQGRLLLERVQCLLTAMQNASAPVKPELLSVLGEQYFRDQLNANGGDQTTFRYKRVSGAACGLPYIVEAAFIKTENAGLKIGINSSVPLGNPLQQNWFNESRGLSAFLIEQKVDFRAECDEYDDDDDSADHGDKDGDPVCLALHLCCPRFSFTDQGKGSIKLPVPFADDIATAILHVVRTWTKYKKARERSQKTADNLADRLSRYRGSPYITQKEAAIRVMEGAYLQARGPDPSPVSPRQIYYVARGQIQELSGKPVIDTYFTQTLLPDFTQENPELTKDWDIVWDDRGHLTEPHTGLTIGLGTANVRRYLADRSEDVYSAILFIEKEGFMEILRAAQFQERFDVAVMSSKGMSTTAARTVIEQCSREQVKIFNVHDFDVSGFTIMGTSSRDTRRYKFDTEPEVIDLGLRLNDVRQMELPSEAVELHFDPTDNLLLNGATPDEVEFLRGSPIHSQNGKARFAAQRVELNAMTVPRFLAWLERKMTEHGVEKVIPDESTLQNEFRAHVRRQKVKSRMRAVEREVAREMKAIKLPMSLRQKVADKFKRNATLSWKAAIAALSR